MSNKARLVKALPPPPPCPLTGNSKWTADRAFVLQEAIPTSLLNLNNDNVGRAVKMFSAMLRYHGDGPDPVDAAQQVELSAKLVHSGIKRPELKDELYMQLVKQTRGNPSEESRTRAWELFLIVASALPPSKVRGEVARERLCSPILPLTWMQTKLHSWFSRFAQLVL